MAQKNVKKNQAEENNRSTPQNSEDIVDNTSDNQEERVKGPEETKESDNTQEADAKEIELQTLKDQLMRTMAEYDNYRKRTIKEKEALYENAVSKTVEEWLPVMDNLSRALNVSKDTDIETMVQGIEMIKKQIGDIFTKLEVVPIKALGEEFNPEYHNAVMHVEDENEKENIIIEEFVKGYMIKDKVLRHSVVKVAN